MRCALSIRSENFSDMMDVSGVDHASIPAAGVSAPRTNVLGLGCADERSG